MTYQCETTGLAKLDFEPTIENYREHKAIDMRMALVSRDYQCYIHGGECSMVETE